MLLRKLVVVGLAGLFSLAANIATAEDADGPTASLVGVDDVNFADPSEAFPDRFQVNLGPGDAARFARLGQGEPSSRSQNAERRYELSVVASATSGFDVAFAQRGGLGFNAQGDIERHSRASELRLGRGLRNMERDTPSSTPKWYVFAASEDEALIWRPGSGRGDFGGSEQGFALQDRVEIGDVQAGITYEQNGWQTSFAYVRREVSVQAGHQTFSEDSNFVGLTLTMRH
jgi:hypothetical protein